MRSAPIMISLALLTLTAGCPKDEDTVPDETDTWTSTDCTDDDGDGVCVEDGDCDDANAEVYPGQSEACDGIDNNCNSITDEGQSDSDGDGTCDGQDAEECDGLDNDGDGEVDEDFGDANGDGVADCLDSEECNGLDDDGDGEVDEGYDADGDGFTQCGTDDVEADCDDADSTAYPGASEIAGDYVDNDCDGLIDEGSWAAGDLVVSEVMNNPAAVRDPDGEWFEVYNASERTLVLNGLVIHDSDLDADGNEDWHQVTSTSTLTLKPGEYFVFGANSDKATNGKVTVDYVYSGVTLANGADDISISLVEDGAVSLTVDTVAWDGGSDFPAPNGASLTLEPGYLDATLNDDAAYWCEATEAWSTLGDYGSPGESNEACSTFDHDGDGYSEAGGDCDDEDATIYPGAPETDSSVDNDCDGDAETGPTARGSASSSPEQCSTLTLDGSSSSDPDGDTSLTYEWELTSAPSGSSRTSADISNADSAVATFEPDEDGTYVFSLTVWDSGGAASSPDSVTVSVSARSSNSKPTADAGSNQTSSDSADCTPLSYGSDYDCDACDDIEVNLDGTGSSDADGDTMSYSWTITAGSGTLDDSTSSTPTLTVAGPVASYGSAATNTVFVALTVTDCMGAASSSDTVAISYSCTGE